MDWNSECETCPHCGHNEICRRYCSEMHCDDGYVDLYEADSDPLWYDPGTYVVCSVCHGYGNEQWCPKCGNDPRLKKPEYPVTNQIP